ncbi:hypothetical protein NG895_01880 [Aeoliella sp. ICT_H6.2]|uniref:Uncharacterized protein n=1 Tax=Aeoliella straminimaris TaxID=2954799 RepID=A0A9X2F5P2_9BACT|nr:hypothetical protein [Aeoliella straminimaris]
MGQDGRWHFGKFRAKPTLAPAAIEKCRRKREHHAPRTIVAIAGPPETLFTQQTPLSVKASSAGRIPLQADRQCA